MAEPNAVPVDSPEGRRRLREMRARLKTYLVQDGMVYAPNNYEGIVVELGGIERFDAGSRAKHAMRQDRMIKFSEQPWRGANMYNVMHARVTDFVSSGVPFKDGALNGYQYLGGMSIAPYIVHPFSSPRDDPGTTEYSAVPEGLEDNMYGRTRTYSPGTYRLESEYIQRPEALMTTSYADASMAQTANMIQWDRGALPTPANPSSAQYVR